MLKIQKILLFLSLAAITFLLPIPSFSQGGSSTYSFLKIPASARNVATGGNTIAVNDSDFTLTFENPSLLNSSMHQALSLNYLNYIADINMGSVGYARNIKAIGIIAASLHYMNYGRFTETDIYDQKIGQFSANDYSLNFSFSKMLHPRFFSGGTVKGIYSSLYENKSYGIAADLAGTYVSKNNSFAAALLLKNLGAQVKSYLPDIREPLPFEIQLGISKKIKYAPLRLLYTLKNLQKWDITLPGKVSFPAKAENNEIYKKSYLTGYNLILHSALGVEFTPLKSFSLRMGYEPKKRSEMRLADRGGLVGFSFGAGLRILRMNLSYARSAYHFAGASNYLSLLVNLEEFTGKRKVSVQETTNFNNK